LLRRIARTKLRGLSSDLKPGRTGKPRHQRHQAIEGENGGGLPDKKNEGKKIAFNPKRPLATAVTGRRRKRRRLGEGQRRKHRGKNSIVGGDPAAKYFHWHQLKPRNPSNQ